MDLSKAAYIVGQGLAWMGTYQPFCLLSVLLIAKASLKNRSHLANWPILL